MSRSSWDTVTRGVLGEYASGLPEPRRICGADGSLYLRRWKLGTTADGGALYLHCFARGDEDSELHNHPWRGHSIILAGGYREERLYGALMVECVYRRGDVNVIEPTTFHRVDLLGHDCWTLFATGPAEHSWGFWERRAGVFTPWREFIARKGLVPRG